MPTAISSNSVVRVWRRLAASLVCALVVAAMAGPSAAAANDEDASRETRAELVPDDNLDSRLLGLDYDGSRWSKAVANYNVVFENIGATNRRLRMANDLAARVSFDRAAARETVKATARQVLVVKRELGVVEDRLRDRAVEMYVRDGSGSTAIEMIDPEKAIDARRVDDLVEVIDEVQLVTRAELSDALELAIIARDAALDRFDELTVQEKAANGGIADLERAAAIALEALPKAEQEVREARRASTVPGTDLTVEALNAYFNAEREVARLAPSCGLQWWMVAGVAEIESRHGSIGGRVLLSTGVSNRPIYGIALDGDGVKMVADTDDGSIDGDAALDRAVGPFQFIPETWQRLKVDGNHDGVLDPQNIYDGAAAAGRLLCRLGGDLTSHANLREAYLGYNYSIDYVNDVHSNAQRYAQLGFS